MPTTQFAFGVYIGRFEPPHNAHLAVMLEALKHVRHLIIVIGSARSPRTAKNPFTEAERRDLITGMLQHAGIPAERVRFAFVRDHFYDEARWLAEVRRGAHEHTEGRADIALIGHIKDDSSYYLRSFPAWTYLPTRVESPLSATEVRKLYFEGDLHDAEKYVPANVAAFLEAFARRAEYDILQREHQFVRDFRAQWRSAPQAPVFVATTAVTTRADEVLLIRRAEPPGQDLLALPGGLLNPARPLLDHCLRELHATLSLPGDVTPTPRGHAVFDYPGRSLLGRVITHAFHFHLDHTPPPEAAGPSGPHPTWLPISKALAQPEAFHEDHHEILTHFLTTP